MEIEYGRMSTIYRRVGNFDNEDNWDMMLSCNKFDEEFGKVSRVSAHYTWHSDVDSHYDLTRPYSPRQLSLGRSLSRHLYDKLRHRV